MTNPMTDIEDKKAQQDLGAMAWRVYEGATNDGANHFQALQIVTAYFAGMFKGSMKDDTEEGGENAN